MLPSPERLLRWGTISGGPGVPKGKLSRYKNNTVLDGVSITSTTANIYDMLDNALDSSERVASNISERVENTGAAGASYVEKKIEKKLPGGFGQTLKQAEPLLARDKFEAKKAEFDDFVANRWGETREKAIEDFGQAFSNEILDILMNDVAQAYKHSERTLGKTLPGLGYFLLDRSSCNRIMDNLLMEDWLSKMATSISGYTPLSAEYRT